MAREIQKRSIFAFAASFFHHDKLTKNQKTLASSWLQTLKSKRELTQEAEAEAREYAVKRAKR
jgi:hypothetical protein